MKFCVVCLIELNNDLLGTLFIFQIDLMILRTLLWLGISCLGRDRIYIM